MEHSMSLIAFPDDDQERIICELARNIVWWEEWAQRQRLESQRSMGLKKAKECQSLLMLLEPSAHTPWSE
jgi:hypothetical protein